MTGSVVLLSGGLDSALNTALAARKTRIELAVTFDYGQAAAQREIEASAFLARHFNVEHRIIAVPWLASESSALTGTNDIPRVSESDLDDPTRAARSASLVWVPNRNGVFVNIAAALAEQAGADLVIAGFNAEEAATFADNGKEFINAVNASLSLSTRTGVKVLSYTADLPKADIAALALDEKVPLNAIWSCYDGNENMCGFCESCRRTRRAFAAIGASDRIESRFETQ